MDKKSNLLSGAITFLGLAIILSGYWLANAIELLASRDLSGFEAAITNLANNKTVVTSELQKEILSFGEAADFLRVSESELYKMIQQKSAIPYKQVGKDYIFSKEALINWVGNKSKNQ